MNNKNNKISASVCGIKSIDNRNYKTIDNNYNNSNNNN